jgi:hypothetical protein
MNSKVLVAVMLVMACSTCVWAQNLGEEVISPDTILTQQPPKTSINGITFDMTRADVTNVLGRFRSAKPAQSVLDSVSYLIFRLSEPRIGIGNARPDVMVSCYQTVFFNQADEVVAIEMRFENLDIDKTQHVLNKLQDKYVSLASDRAYTYNYQVDPNVILRTEVLTVEYQSDPIGGPRKNMSNVKNTYMYESKYREALKKTNKAVIIENLL